MILRLALIPLKSFQDEVNVYRRRCGSHYVQIMPCITIKPQSEIDDHDFNLVKNGVKNRISSVKPVEVHVIKTLSFAPVSNVIYFKVAETESLGQLFNQFNAEDFHGIAEHPSVPHFTITQGLTGQEFGDIYGQIKLARVNHREIIEKLSLLRYSEEEDRWIITGTFTSGQKVQNYKAKLDLQNHYC